MAKIKFDRMSAAGAMCTLLAALSGCGSDAESVDSERQPLVAVCTETGASMPDGVWICGEPRTVECDARPGTASPATIYVVTPDACVDRRLLVEEGPFALGQHEIVVTEELEPAPLELCRSLLTVVDTTPPQAHPTHTTLWPPNHKLHAISAQACAGVLDACDPNVSVHFTGATSDEPPDAKGDGSFEPDIMFDSADSATLRAERQGPATAASTP